jgi:Spy/CpxP family protein refolding chaperone
MRGIRCLVAAVLAAGIVTVVAAQPGRQPGGFGQGQDTYMLVLTNKALQEEVKVTDAQKDKFKTITEKQKEMTDKVRADFKDKLADSKGDKDKSKEVRTEMGKETSKITAEVRKMLDTELTTEQKTRLKQIGVQVMGINAFADPDAKTGGGGGFGGFGGGFSDSQKATIKEVADALKLTDAQKTKIKGLIEEYTKDRASVQKDIFGETTKGKGGFGKVDPEKQKDFQTKSAKLTTEVMGKITDSLDDTQKTAWKGLVGDAFDTSKLRPNFAPKKD